MRVLAAVPRPFRGRLLLGHPLQNPHNTAGSTPPPRKAEKMLNLKVLVLHSNTETNSISFRVRDHRLGPGFLARDAWLWGFPGPRSLPCVYYIIFYRVRWRNNAKYLSGRGKMPTRNQEGALTASMPPNAPQGRRKLLQVGGRIQAMTLPCPPRIHPVASSRVKFAISDALLSPSSCPN
jgi:hypothetical protein